MGKKNLDKLFHQKLKDFSEVPDDKVWQSIETSLDEKKKSHKVIPIWWKLGGVAAVLLLAITLLNPFKEIATNSPTMTDVDVKTESTSEENKTNENLKIKSSEEVQIVDAQNEITPNSKEQKIERIVHTKTISSEGFNSTSALKSPKKEQNSLGVQVANSEKTEVQKTMKQNDALLFENTFDKINQETVIADSGSSKTELEKNLSQSASDIKDNRISNEIGNSAKEIIAQNNSEDTSEAIEESKKKSLFEEIEAQEQEEEEEAAENTGNKWSAGPSIAPVYYNAIGEGSPVNSIFVPNSKSGDVNLSYGLSVVYAVSKKLSIRSGIHKVDYGYRTNDVEFSSSLENATGNQIDNIDYTLDSKNLVLNSRANSNLESFSQNPLSDSSLSDVSAVSEVRDGVMEQQFGYLEVPVELSYALLDKKFEINLIGGVSSLFLVDNSISLISGELTTEVGEANNLNSVNFSTNVGFGLNYNVTSKVQLNIEPVFKYQLNTFSNTDGTFNPFSVGVYSGLSFKF